MAVDLDVPVVYGERVDVMDGLMSFAEAERCLLEEISTTHCSPFLEPHLTNAPTKNALQTSIKSEIQTRSKSMANDKKHEMRRLEAFAASACFRDMDRQDILFKLLGPNGQFLIRKSAFTIGCLPPPIENPENTAGPSTTAEIGHIHKKKRNGKWEETSDAVEIDIDIAKEGCSSTEPEIFAQIWVKSNGKCYLKSTGTKSVTVDNTPVVEDKCQKVCLWSMIEIDDIQLMLIINQNATNRVWNRSKYEMDY